MVDGSAWFIRPEGPYKNLTDLWDYEEQTGVHACMTDVARPVLHSACRALFIAWLVRELSHLLMVTLQLREPSIFFWGCAKCICTLDFLAGNVDTRQFKSGLFEGLAECR